METNNQKNDQNIIPNDADKQQKGVNVPNLRFSEFNNYYSKCILDDIADVTKLAGFEFTKYVTYNEHGSIIALRGLNCKDGRLILDDVKFIDNSNLKMLKRSKLYINDILFTYVGTVGETAIITENDKYYLAPNVARIRLKTNQFNAIYLQELLNTNKFKQKIISPLIATSSQPALTIENIRLFKLKLPNIYEQTKVAEFFTIINARIDTQSKIIEDLEYCKKDLKSISDKIVGFEDVEKYERKRQEAVQQLARFEQAKAGNHDAIVRLKALIEANEKEIDKLIVANEKNKKIQRYCDYAQAIYDWFKDFYDKQEKEVKDDLLASINENFSKMYHGSREITMNNDYKITPVLTGDKSELAKSEGLETVTNFSFIMGLVELARKKAMKPADEDLANQPITEPYPIVMDAPFSNTDIKHIENITARLPEVAEQVIIFLMDKDWSYARKELEKHLGSKYVIEKVDNQDNHSTLRREI